MLSCLILSYDLEHGRHSISVSYCYFCYYAIGLFISIHIIKSHLYLWTYLSSLFLPVSSRLQFRFLSPFELLQMSLDFPNLNAQFGYLCFFKLVSKPWHLPPAYAPRYFPFASWFPLSESDLHTIANDGIIFPEEDIPFASMQWFGP